jgi:Ras-related C3 botulinum toxin substrate 1
MAAKGACKVVAVGDGAVGKTCLLMVYVQNIFPDEYVPTVFENYDTNIKFQDSIVKLSLWDTAGQEEYDKLRYLSYPNTNVFLVCFSVVSKSSFDNVKLKWLKELAEYSPGTPVILVGTKVDLREDEEYLKKIPKDEIITKEMGEQLCQEINGKAYIETSARLMTNVSAIFEKAVEVKFGKPSTNGTNDGGKTNTNGGQSGSCCNVQ